MVRLIVSIAAVSGFISVAMGAFGAHVLKDLVLKDRLEQGSLKVFETAVSYQMSHTLLLLIICVFISRFPDDSLFKWAAWALISGIVLFSGSLYGLSMGGYKFLGPVTPVGGLAFLLGWLLLGIAAWRNL